MQGTACPKCMREFTRLSTHYQWYPDHAPGYRVLGKEDSSTGEEGNLPAHSDWNSSLNKDSSQFPSNNEDSSQFPTNNGDEEPQTGGANDGLGAATQVVGSSFTYSMAEHSLRGTTCSPWDRSMAELYLAADRAGGHRFLVDQLLSIMKKEKIRRGFDPLHVAVTKRDAFLNRVMASPTVRKATVIPVQLDLGFSMDIYGFPVQQSIQDVLLGELYSKAGNICPTRSKDPWDDSPILVGPPTTIRHGKWFRRTHSKVYETIPTQERSLHIMDSLHIYTDRCAADGRQKNGLEPVTVSFGSLTIAARESNQAWVTLGFIPNMEEIQRRLRKARATSKKKAKISKGVTFRVYHQCLEALLQPVVDLQKSKPQMLHRRGQEVSRRTTHFKVAGVSCDGKAADYLAAKVMDKGPTTPRLSRRCLTNSCCSDVPEHKCCLLDGSWVDKIISGALGCTYRMDSANLEKWKDHLNTHPSLTTAGKRRDLIRMRKLREKILALVCRNVFGAHPVLNAFRHIDFGANPGGIHRALFADIMHSLEEGLVPRLLEVLYGGIPPSLEGDIDSLVEGMISMGNRSAESREYPRTNYNRGFSRLTLLTADERMGQLFVTAILLSTDKGREVLRPRFQKDFDENRTKARFGNPEEEEGMEDDHSEEEDEKVEDEDEGQKEEDNHDDCQKVLPTGPNPSLASEVLQKLDLSFLLQDIHPSLPQFHQNRLDDLIQKNIIDNHTNRTLGIRAATLPAGLADYERVDTAQRTPTYTEHDSDDESSSSDSSTSTHEEEREYPSFRIEESRKEFSIRLTMDQFRLLVELILSFHAFLKYGSDLLVTKEDWKRYQGHVSLIKSMVTKGIVRGEGTFEHRTQKFLELSHFVPDSKFFEPCEGGNTSRGERSLKGFKKMAATAQARDESTLVSQTANRISESMVLAQIQESTLALDGGIYNVVKKNPAFAVGTGTCFSVSRGTGARNISVVRTMSNGMMPHPEQVALEASLQKGIKNVFLPFFRLFPQTKQYHLYTEFRLRDGSQLGTLVRAHPDYNKEGEWRDYAWIEYEGEDRYPAKLLGFYRNPSSEEWMTLVQHCVPRNQRQMRRDSPLFRHYRLSAEIGSISVDSIHSGCLVLEYGVCGSTTTLETAPPSDCSLDILLVEERKTVWAQEFLKSPLILGEELGSLTY
jgi:hypothetical protein